MWAQLFPNAAHVFAEPESSNIESLSFGPDGRVTGANFYCDTYDAAQYDTHFTFGGMDEEATEATVEEVYYKIMQDGSNL
jgi:hypothetical protein